MIKEKSSVSLLEPSYRAAITGDGIYIWNIFVMMGIDVAE